MALQVRSHISRMAGYTFLNGGDAFSIFKLPKISCLFDNNLSPGIGGAPCWKPYLKNGMVENFLKGGLYSVCSYYPKSFI
jgi:hypothetical protein